MFNKNLIHQLFLTLERIIISLILMKMYMILIMEEKTIDCPKFLKVIKEWRIKEQLV